MVTKKNLSKTQKKVAEVLDQAKASLKRLGKFEKETLAKAKMFVRIPSAADRKRMTGEKILTGLRKLGVASHTEVAALEKKLHRLEASLHSRRN